VPGRSWEVEFDPTFETWAEDLDQPDAEALLAAIRVMRDHGPALGRPLVDSVKGSRHKNMKELRPGSTARTEVRVLFAFDPKRRAILLVGGDKANAWSKWYEVNVPDRRRALRRPPAPAEGCARPDRGHEQEEETMSARDWEKRVLIAKGAEERVAEIEQELLLANRLTALREGAGLSQRELAKRLGVSQPRVVAIERSHNVTIEVLEQYVEALGAKLEVNVVKGRRKTRLLGANNEAAKSA